MSFRDENCQLCSLHSTANTVCMAGRGSKSADIMVIGEAPGRQEDERGEPFVGSAGKVLMSNAQEVGLNLEDAYLCNAVSCRPPENRTPSKREIKACNKWLTYRMMKVKPKFVLLLGNVPCQAVLGMSGIKRLRGKPVERDGVIYFPTYHPAFVLRDPANASTFQADLKRFRDIVEFGGIPYERAVDYEIVESHEQVQRMLDSLTGTVSVDIETTGLYQWASDFEVVSVGLGTRNKQWIIPVHAEAWKTPWTNRGVQGIMEDVAERLEDCFVVGHNFKFDALGIWKKFGIELRCDFDTMLAHYLIDENSRHGLDYLAGLYFGASNWDVDLKLKQGKAGKLKDHALYLAQDLYYTRELRGVLGRLLKADPEVNRVFQKIMMPCVALFIEAEYFGVYIDQSKFAEAETYLRGELSKAEADLREVLIAEGALTAEEIDRFNWGSPVQVADLLFHRLKIPVLDKTAAGKPSTSESVLKRIDHACVDALLRMRAAKQQLSFFIEGWKPFLDSKGYLHPSFKLHGTVTGRLSAEHPNLQQVPRDPRIRSLITAPEGWTLLEADLSQIELRIAAELANERAMLHAFATGVDTHWLTAMKEIARGGGYAGEIVATALAYVRRKDPKGRAPSYGDAIKLMLEMGPDVAVEINGMWKEVRKKAKAVNFGYLYGMWWKKFKLYARDNYGVTVTDDEAQASRTGFFDTYPDFPGWHDRQRKFVRSFGYVRSLSGRKRRLPAALSRENTPERQEAERQAINSPVQSFANELNLMAAIQLRKEFGRNVVRLCGTVHDAILARVRNDKLEEVHNRLLEIMSHPKLLDEFDIKLKVPILAEAKVGPWGIGKDLHKWLSSR